MVKSETRESILGLAAKAAEACPTTRQTGLVEMLQRVESLVSELRGVLDVKGVCGKVPEVCEGLEMRLEGVKRAEDAANTLLLEFADLLLGFQRSRADEVVERFSRLQSLAGVVYSGIRELVGVLGVVREFFSAYERLVVGRLDIGAARALVDGVLWDIRNTICGYILGVVEGLKELRGYYEARGRLTVYRAFELVFGQLALLLSGVVKELEEAFERA